MSMKEEEKRRVKPNESYHPGLYGKDETNTTGESPMQGEHGQKASMLVQQILVLRYTPRLKKLTRELVNH